MLLRVCAESGTVCPRNSPRRRLIFGPTPDSDSNLRYGIPHVNRDEHSIPVHWW